MIVGPTVIAFGVSPETCKELPVIVLASRTPSSPTFLSDEISGHERYNSEHQHQSDNGNIGKDCAHHYNGSKADRMPAFTDSIFRNRRHAVALDTLEAIAE